MITDYKNLKFMKMKVRCVAWEKVDNIVGNLPMEHKFILRLLMI